MPFSGSKRVFIVRASAVIIGIITVIIFAVFIGRDGSSIQVCDGSSRLASIKYAAGFASTKPRSSFSPAFQQDADVSITPAGRYEFVLQPGSLGQVKISYDFCPNAFILAHSTTLNYSESFPSTYSPSQTIYRLNDRPDSNTTGPLSLTLNNDQDLLTEVNSTDVGVTIFYSDLKKLDSHTLGMTFTISAEPSADRATYVITNFGICPGELLTIGDTPNERSLEWANGAFYGCG